MYRELRHAVADREGVAGGKDKQEKGRFGHIATNVGFHPNSNITTYVGLSVKSCPDPPLYALMHIVHFLTAKTMTDSNCMNHVKTAAKFAIPSKRALGTTKLPDK
ncbi:hypothetical protein HELRODRAFT_169051 [Helobdella robusta]|uniref:Uncharacterized protein n=1 Tax=Helobdella robusta TaxID=6412 RepID=T1F1B7_HELRO|nr:hypothetical protein HELRODRAFT_169051 [Helobdella robusta]ESO09111.1 hypothetical protein HELRODRAFT_169051 [Helobdella robusta]